MTERTVGVAIALVFAGFLAGGGLSSFSWLWAAIAYPTALNSLWWVLLRVYHGASSVYGETSADGVLWIFCAVPGAALAVTVPVLPADGSVAIISSALIVLSAILGAVCVWWLRVEWADQSSYFLTNPEVDGGSKWRTWSSLFMPDIGFADCAKAAYSRDSLSTIVFAIAISGLSASTWLFTFTTFRDHQLVETLIQVFMMVVYSTLIAKAIAAVLALEENDGPMPQTEPEEPVQTGFWHEILDSILRRARGGDNGTGQAWRPLPREKVGIVLVILIVGTLGATGPILVLLLAWQ